jgi:DNA-directed RNA polymerase specialized sigma24 family protein
MADEEDQKQKSLETLLTWLDPDRDEAWEKYQEIWERLIKIFTWNWCKDVEELAGEVMKRVEPKVPELMKKFSAEDDPAPYFYKVANILVLENHRTEARFSEFEEERGLGGVTYPVEPGEIDVYDLKLGHLDCCLKQLSEDDREIVLGFYDYEAKSKLADRRRLAERFGLTMNALWIRASRLRARVRKCVSKRIEGDDQVQ